MGVNEFLDDSPISFDVSTTLEKNATTLFYFGRTRGAGITATTILRGLIYPIGVSHRFLAAFIKDVINFSGF